MLIYKYLPPERIDVLRDGRIRFTPPAALNDPFECSPILDSSAPVESLRRAAFDQIDSMLAEHLAEVGESSSDGDRARKLVDKTKNDLVAQMNPDQLSAKCVDTVRSMLSESIGVLSLSKTATSTVMWAHYAQDHAGFLIGFDTESEWFHVPDACGRRTPYWNVRYSDSPAVVPVGDSGELGTHFPGTPR